MTNTPIYLLDQLETTDMLVIDGLHAFNFQLDDALLDQADAAAEAGEPFASETVVLTVEVQDGRERKRWQFSYNAVMEAEYLAAQDSWRVGEHHLTCLAAVSSDAED